MRIKEYLKLIPWLALVLGLMSTGIIWYRYQALIENKNQIRLQSYAQQIKLSLKNRLYIYTDALYGAVGLFHASVYVDRQEWLYYLKSINLNERFPGIQAMGFVEPVMHSQREEYVKKMRSEGAENFEIKPKGVRPYYYVVKYVEPLEKNQASLGHDLGTKKVIYKALEASMEAAQPVVTSRLYLDENKQKQAGFMLLLPFYKYHKLDSSYSFPTPLKGQRAKELQGWVYGAFISKDFFSSLLNDSILDANNYVYLKAEFSGKKRKKYLLFNNFVNNDAETETAQLTLYGRTWFLSVSPKPGFYSPVSIVTEIVILASGIFLSLLFFAFLRLFFFRQKSAEELAIRMTSELQDKAFMLERANEDIYQFIHIASHDLKTPLHAMHSILEWMQEDFSRDLQEKSKKQFSMLFNKIERLDLLLDRLVEYSQIRKTNEEIKLERVNLEDLVIEIYHALPNENNVKLQLEGELPEVRTHREYLAIIFKQLIHNALIFSRKEGGVVSVGVVEDETYFRFSVKDNGPGIPENFRKNVLRMYKTLRSHGEMETAGMGLAIAKKIVGIYGGEIELTSNEWNGLTCYFTWPKEID